MTTQRTVLLDERDLLVWFVPKQSQDSLLRQQYDLIAQELSKSQQSSTTLLQWCYATRQHLRTLRHQGLWHREGVDDRFAKWYTNFKTYNKLVEEWMSGWNLLKLLVIPNKVFNAIEYLTKTSRIRNGNKRNDHLQMITCECTHIHTRMKDTIRLITVINKSIIY